LHWLLHWRSNWQMVIEQSRPAVRIQLPMQPYHHHSNHQYILQSIQILQI
jgi:hypothetical protein